MWPERDGLKGEAMKIPPCPANTRAARPVLDRSVDGPPDRRQADDGMIRYRYGFPTIGPPVCTAP